MNIKQDGIGGHCIAFVVDKDVGTAIVVIDDGGFEESQVAGLVQMEFFEFTGHEDVGGRERKGRNVDRRGFGGPLGPVDGVGWGRR